MASVIPKPEAKSSASSASPGHRLLDTDLAKEVEFLAARARAVGTATANQLLSALDLKVRSYSVLALACSGHDPSQRELAEFLSLDASQIVALVDELESRGLVARAPDPRDRRSNSIVSTAAGRKLYAAAREVVGQAENESLKELSLAERDTLRSLLHRIAFA